jgi:tetratricopeptide (TPR) repeat protein
MKHVFIVRPFGRKGGVDFDRVETDLIQPAMRQAGLSGGTTGQIVQQGNIRADMFEQLLIADLVIADISIHNANVFYELGIRHALRDKRTFLIRARIDRSKEADPMDKEVPFDLKTDRYLAYDADHPGASVAILAAALGATLDSLKADSPVYQLLPELDPADPSKFLAVPIDFREEVERAEEVKNCADLQLFAAELDGFPWRMAGLRFIGHAQRNLRDWRGAKATWRTVRDYDEMDVEANTLLGTIYQRLGDRVASNQALERALQNTDLTPRDRAEILALMGRNAKMQWEQTWADSGELDERQRTALTSPYLEKSLELYRQGFAEDRNHFYSGLNALAMVTVLTELANVQTLLWQDGFDTHDEAERKLRDLKELRTELAVGVKLAIESKQAALRRDQQTDVWAEVSSADLTCLISTRPNRVGLAYKRALAGASDFAMQPVRRQLLLYQKLGVLGENIQAGLDSIPPVALPGEGAPGQTRVLLFTGHRVDAPDRKTPRFPATKVQEARAMILDAVKREKEKPNGQLFGISGGASGADILFQEVCEELGIPSQMYLVLPKSDYIKTSVADAGPDWVERFNRLFDKLQPKILSDSGELPRWLRAKKDYSIWQRSNLWMLHNALSISQDHLTLIALWNGAKGDGPGGAEDTIKRAIDRGASLVHLDARMLLA